jgi:hypothetical protein
MADDYSSDTSTSGYLSPGGQASGSFETSGDRDWFRITLAAGQFYSFELSGGAGYNQFLSFYDSLGNYVSGYQDSYGATQKYTVKPTTTGTYYVAAGDQAYSNDVRPLTYTLKAGTGVSDDAGDTRATATALSLGQAVTGALQSYLDVDYFKVTLVAGVTYAFTPTWTSNNVYATLRFEDADGNYISGPTGNGSLTPTRSGDYYVALSGNSSQVPAYSLVVNATVDDHSASTADPGRLLVGSTGSAGKLEVSGDRDWFKVTLAAGTTYWLTLAGDGTSTAYNGSAVFKLLDTAGNTVATYPGYTYVNAGSSLLIPYVPAKTGTYYLEVAGDGYSSGGYKARAVVGEADDYADQQTTDAASITPGTTIAGKLAIPQDQDVFKLAVEAGKTYLVELTGKSSSQYGSIDLNGTAAGGAYQPLVEYSKTGVSEYRVLTANTTGDYYFTVQNSYGNGTGTGTYAITVTEPSVDDFATGIGTQGVLAVGAAVHGRLDYVGDADTFRITLQYGAKYAFQLRGASSGEGSLPADNVLLQVTGSDGNYVYLNGGQDGTYTFSSTTGGDYYVSLQPKSYLGNASLTGSYALYAFGLTGDVAAPALTSATALTNVPLTGNLTLHFSENIVRGSSGEVIALRDSLGVTLESYYSGDSRVSVVGDTLTINPSMVLKPGTKYLLSIGSGSVTDLAGNKFATSELITIDTVSATAAGGDGNDLLVGLGSGLSLHGSHGVDTVVYGYSRSAYTVARSQDSTVVTSTSWDNPARTGDTLDGVERLMFSDTSVALDIDGHGGMAYRLYQAAFDRTPDLPGLGFWMAHLDNGMSLLQVARNFIGSEEFTTLYGASLSNKDFITRLYANVLDRAPDQVGADWWLDKLDRGVERAEVLAGFSESPENQANVLQVIGNGFEYVPYG